jgi:hypothetical protein
MLYVKLGSGFDINDRKRTKRIRQVKVIVVVDPPRLFKRLRAETVWLNYFERLHCLVFVKLQYLDKKLKVCIL